MGVSCSFPSGSFLNHRTRGVFVCGDRPSLRLGPQKRPTTHLSIIHPTVICGWIWTPQGEGLRKGSGNEKKEGKFSISSSISSRPSSGWSSDPVASLNVDFACCCFFWSYHSGARPALAAMGSQGCQACRGPLGRMGMMDSRGPRESQVSLLAWMEAGLGAGSAGPQSPDLSFQTESVDLAACYPHLPYPVEGSKEEPLSLQAGDSLFILQVDT